MELIGIVGFKNSGKTTLITRLIPALGALGISVSTIKHVHHSIDLDHPGKDTFAHRVAGAVDVAMVSGERWAILHERPDAGAPIDLTEVVRRLSPVDLVLVEGFKSLAMRRIEIRTDGNPPLGDGSDSDTIAIVSDGDAPGISLPLFRRDDIEPLAAFIATLVSGRPAI